MSAWDCEHQSTEVRAMRIRGGGIQYRHQCLACGSSVGNAISHALVAKFIEWDVDLQERFEAAARAKISEQRQSAIARTDEHSAMWREAYGRYLATPAWRARRAAVLERDGGKCCGCLRRPAEEVHHLTYAHVGHEFAFELVSLCSPCHERFHAEGAAPEFCFDA